MFGLGRYIVIVVAIALSGVAAWRLAMRWHPSAEHYPVQGIDVSEANGPIDWAVVKGGGADFGYAIATIGATARDTMFQTNWDAMENAGIRRGAMHVYSLCQPATEQADLFNTTVPAPRDALPAAVVVRYDDGCTARPDRAQLIHDLALFVRRIESHTREPVLLKFDRAVERDYRLSNGIKRNIWAVGNFLAPGYAARPWRMWQASNIRRIDGIEGPVNWDVAVP